jgi:hypothetical protein
MIVAKTEKYLTPNRAVKFRSKGFGCLADCIIIPAGGRIWPFWNLLLA